MGSLKYKDYNWEPIKIDIEEGGTINEISFKYKMHPNTVRDNICRLYPFLKDKIKANGEDKQKRIRNTNGGRTAEYCKIRREIKEKLHICFKCGGNKNLQIHHHIPIDYEKYPGGWEDPNFMGTLDERDILCSSCHQKLHYRERGRKVNTNKDKLTGRWKKNEY